MSGGINKVIIIGRLGRDPETKSFPNGGSVTNVSVATSLKWKDSNTGADREETEWHRLVFNGRLGEVVQEYLTTGSQIYVEGRLRTEKWQNAKGQDCYTTKIVVNKLEMLGGGTRQEPAGNEYSDYTPIAQPAAPARNDVPQIITEANQETVIAAGGLRNKSVTAATKTERATRGARRTPAKAAPVQPAPVAPAGQSYSPNHLDDDLPF